MRAWEAFAPFLIGAPELPVPATVSAPAAQPADLSAAASAQAFAMRDAAHDRARVPFVVCDVRDRRSPPHREDRALSGN